MKTYPHSKVRKALPLATAEQAARFLQLTYAMNHIPFDGDYNEAWYQFNLLHDEFEDLAHTADFFDKTFEESGKYGVKRVTGEILVPAVADMIPTLYRLNVKLPGYPAILNGKMGLLKTDGSGEWLVDPQYDSIYFNPTIPAYKTWTNNRRFGYLDMKGHELVPCEMSWTEETMHDGILMLRKDGKFGFLTSRMQYIPPIYDKICNYYFGSGAVTVLKDGQWGYILYDSLEFISKEEYENENSKNYNAAVICTLDEGEML